jgi:hypothetical protein
MLLAATQLVAIAILYQVGRDTAVIQITLLTAIARLDASLDFSSTQQKALGAVVSAQGREVGYREGDVS